MRIRQTMKERPILFNGTNVRRLLDGRKTMTRRVVRWPPWVDDEDRLKLSIQNPATGLAFYSDGVPVKRFTCPYGVPGDRLWVRETWKPGKSGGGIPRLEITFGDSITWREGCPESMAGGPWKPSIFMPKWACRLWLEVTDVRVERLQEITEEDAVAEGVERGRMGPISVWSYRAGFWTSWNAIYAKRGHSWESNPWVWVVSFRKVDNVKEAGDESS